MDKTTLALRVATLRCDRGLSQEELAAAVGVTVRTVGNIERAATEPELRIVVALAELFGVSLDYLVGRTAA
jgi:DNA-binding XRE family transcriptional regulator